MGGESLFSLFRDVQRIRLENFGVRGSAILAPSEQEQAENAIAALQPCNVSLNEVVHDWIARRRDASASISFETDMDAFLEIGKRSESYFRSIRQTRNRLESLHGKLLNTITPADLTTAMDGMAASYPAYVSLQTALFHHGMISQIPEVIYAVTLAKPQRFRTSLGVVSLHRIDPGFFFGFEPADPGGIQMASPEKALLDIFYLSPARSRLFTNLPEVELPRKFSWKTIREMIQRIPAPQRRTLVERRVEEFRKRNHMPDRY